MTVINSFQKYITVLHDTVIRNAVFVAPADAFRDVLPFHGLQFVRVASVQNQVDGGVNGLHLLLPNDGVALFYFIQKVRIMLNWQQGRDRGIRRNILQLPEHGDQLGQQPVRGPRFEMLADNVSFRICVAACARF